MKCADRRDLMGEYALGLLDEAEAAEIRGHLASGCPACAAALAEAEATLAQLPRALPPVPPPPAARARLLAKLPPREVPAPLRLDPRRRSALMPLAWAASLLLAVGGSLWLAGAQRHRQMDDLQKRIDALAHVEQDYAASRAQIAELTADKQRLGVSLASANETIGMLRAEKLKLVEMVAAGSQPSTARARALWDQDAQHWQLIATDMKPMPGRTFELWFITADGKAVPAGTFDVDARGNAIHTVAIPADIGTIVKAAVTDEPALMSKPTGKPQLATSKL